MAARRLPVGVAAVLSALLLANCSSGPSDAAKSFCATIMTDHFTAAPNQSLSLPRKLITEGETSGNKDLQEATRRLVAALDRDDPSATATAFSDVQRACIYLGLT